MAIDKIQENKSKGQKIKIICPNCHIETNHEVVASIDVSGCEEKYDIQWNNNYQIVRCLGCDSLSFRIEKSDSESYDPEYCPFTEDLYPRRSTEPLSNKTFYSVPFNIKKVYSETIEAYNNDMFILCSSGVRALVEAICLERKIKDGLVTNIDSQGNTTPTRKATLEGKINGLAEKGILTKENAEALHEHRLIGNEALHRMSIPSKEGLRIAIGIVENALESIYEIRSKIKKVREARGVV